MTGYRNGRKQQIETQILEKVHRNLNSQGELRFAPGKSFFMLRQSIFSSSSRGFTLIELLVVILIIAVMGAIITPAYSRFLEKARFEGQVREIIDIFSYAREKAVENDTVLSLTFDRQSETFRVQGTAPPPPTDLPENFTDSNRAEAPLSSQIDAGLQLSEEYQAVNFQVGSGPVSSREGGSGTIHFQGDGTTEGATLNVTSKTGDVVQLELSATTGRIKRADPDSQTQP